MAAVAELVHPAARSQTPLVAHMPRTSLEPGADREPTDVLGHAQRGQRVDVEVRPELREDLGVLRRILRQVPGDLPTRQSLLVAIRGAELVLDRN